MSSPRGVLLVLLVAAAACGSDGTGVSDNADDSGDDDGSGGLGGVTVERVSDGDSFVARLESGTTAEVRLIGINAPEFGECLDRESRRTLTDLIGDQAIVLVPDVTDRDQYGRLLRYVEASGVLVNQELVERGLALTTSTPPDVAHEADLDAAQGRARAGGLGMWNRDACGPAASTALQITHVEADPRGRDEHDLNGEYVVVANSGETAVDMAGWKLRDDSTRNRFWFPEEFTLAPGSQVTIHAGAGNDTGDALHWGRRYPIWDNDRDTALLLDPRGNVVSYYDVR